MHALLPTTARTCSTLPSNPMVWPVAALCIQISSKSLWYKESLHGAPNKRQSAE
jgi:hypothetical protein